MTPASTPLALTLRFCLAIVAFALASQQPAAAQSGLRELLEARRLMVQEEIANQGIENERLLEAMRDVPREQFVPLSRRNLAYLNVAIAYDDGQVILPPLVTAHLIEQLNPHKNDKVLVIGPGSGYSTALLSRMVREVFAVEIDPVIAKTAEETLARLKYTNVKVRVGDGFEGWKEHAPYQRIIVECSPDSVPKALVEQLAEGGILLVPIGDEFDQTMHLCKKENGKLTTLSLWPTLLLPMKGKAEELRSQSEMPRDPSILNGGFEELVPKTKDVPAHWAYVRQGRAIAGEFCPEGKNSLAFVNLTPGAAAMALQAFPVDGKKVSELSFACNVWGKDIRPGQNRQQLPRVEVRFFDEKRRLVGGDWMGGWNLTFDWLGKEHVFSVPRTAKFAVLRIGLCGATGEIRFDDLKLEYR
ncbi:MAG: protein-L-isoaspartate O-methyltransferase [Planctomycetales bacterium]|nr:protein-L-isoaspartate O-methyltransferase [Planctomycetales bacterium]